MPMAIPKNKAVMHTSNKILANNTNNHVGSKKYLLKNLLVPSSSFPTSYFNRLNLIMF